MADKEAEKDAPEAGTRLHVTVLLVASRRALDMALNELGFLEDDDRVIEHDGRLAYQGPGDRDPLALPARELGGTGMGALGQADQVQGVERALAALLEGDAGVEETIGNVVQHGGVLGQEELLEDEPDPGGP